MPKKLNDNIILKEIIVLKSLGIRFTFINSSKNSTKLYYYFKILIKVSSQGRIPGFRVDTNKKKYRIYSNSLVDE